MSKLRPTATDKKHLKSFYTNLFLGFYYFGLVFIKKAKIPLNIKYKNIMFLNYFFFSFSENSLVF